jgi:hypothetical protein
MIGGLFARLGLDDSRALRIVNAQNRLASTDLRGSTAIKLYDEAIPRVVDDFHRFFGISDDVTAGRHMPTADDIADARDRGISEDLGFMHEWRYLPGQIAEAIERAGGVPGLIRGD